MLFEEERMHNFKRVTNHLSFVLCVIHSSLTLSGWIVGASILMQVYEHEKAYRKVAFCTLRIFKLFHELYL